MARRWQRLLLVFSLLVLSFYAFPPKAYSQTPQDFIFDSFSADYYFSREADKSSRLEVKETLVARFPDFDQNHGILRAIPQRYKGHTLSLKILSVTDEAGKPYQYSEDSQNDNLVLKIGDPDSFVHGAKTYKINYSLKDALSFYSTHDELFWDVNGDQWAQPFTTVTANFHIPSELKDALDEKQACYAGYFGDLSSSCTINRTAGSGGMLVTASASNVQPQQTLSVVLSFKKGTFAKSQEVRNEDTRRKISQLAAVSLAAGLPISAFLLMLRRWREFGDDPKGRGVIVPQYEPPKDFDCLRSDFLMQQKLRTQAISAMLIELAVGGYVVIYEIPKKGWFGKKDYELELKKMPDHAHQTTRDGLSAIFAGLKPGTKVKMSTFKNNHSTQMDMYKKIKKLDQDLAMVMHSLGFFVKNPKAVRNGYLIWGSLIVFAGAFAGWTAIYFKVWALGGLALGLILAGIVVVSFARIMPARTQAGVDSYDHLLGLKDYIKLAEAERLRYLQSPEGAEKISHPDKFDPKTPAAKVKLFEELLPYAILFGLEKQWAKQFQDLYTTPPGWYNGDWTTFNAVYLGASLSDFSSVGATSFASPSSSGSGFSGGGAGGGGGGGGGGGW